MKIGVESLVASTPEGIIDGYRLLKEWGFDAADAGIYAPLKAGEISKKVVNEALLGRDRDVLKLFEPWKKGAELYGVENYQAHAIYPTYSMDGGDAAYNDYLLTVLKKQLMALID